MKTAMTMVVLMGAVWLVACDDDPMGDCYDCGGFPTFRQEDLTQRWHVLNNIEYSYSRRSPNIYDELLDGDFMFYFSPGDVGGGAPESWNRAEDLEANTRLFNSNVQSDPPADPVCRSMRFDLIYDKDALTWIESVPGDYSTTVFYTFTFEIEPNTTYIAQNGAKAELTVRNVGTQQNPRWELVGLRDLGSTLMRTSAAIGQTSTWGSVKAIYPPSS